MAQQTERETEGRLPVLIAVIGLGGSFLALPGPLLLGPRWLIPAVVGGLLVPTFIAHVTRQHRLDNVLGYGISVIVTLALMGSLALLLRSLPLKLAPPAPCCGPQRFCGGPTFSSLRSGTGGSTPAALTSAKSVASTSRARSSSRR